MCKIIFVILFDRYLQRSFYSQGLDLVLNNLEVNRLIIALS